MVVFLTHRGNDMYWNEFMSNDTWYGVTVMYRSNDMYWNNVMSIATYNVIVIVIV